MRKQYDSIPITFRPSTGILSMVLLVFLLSNLVSTARADVVWDPASVILERHQVGQGVYALIPKGATEANKKGRYHQGKGNEVLMPLRAKKAGEGTEFQLGKDWVDC